MPPELDADMAAQLTPEELAAIQDDDQPSGDELAAMQRIADGAAKNDDDDGNDDDAGDPNAAPIEGKGATPAAAANTDTGAATDEDPAPAAVAHYDAKLPSDYDDQIKALKDRDAELRQKFKDGDIDIDERDQGLAELSEQREQLVVLRAKAEISQEMTQQTAQQQWQNSVNTFMSSAAKEEGGIDYRKDAAKAEDLDTFVKHLANKVENSDKPMDWFLTEAHKRVQALHGVTPTPNKADALKAAKDQRKPSLDSLPKTLAQVPGGDGPGDVGSEFADIEALEGQAYEDAIARMTPAQREKFLRSA
jgi:hypothetical protein